MSISFTGAAGDLFPVLGRLGKVASQLRSYQTSQTANLTSQAAGVIGQLDNEPDIQAVVGSAYLSLIQQAGTNVQSLLRTVAERYVNRVVYRDAPRNGQTMTTLATLASLLKVIQDMKDQGQSVLAMTVTATPSGSVAGKGNGVVVASTKRALDGLVLENSFAETLTLTCTADSYVGGRVAGNESFSVQGEGAQRDYFAQDWPLGSGASAQLSSVDGNSSNANGNILTNSGYESWSGDTPANWEVTAGTPGTHVFREGSLNYDGSYSLRLVGDGSTLTALRQIFGSSTGTLGTLEPLTQYALNVWARRDGIQPGAGVWVFELVDGNGAVINDEAGVANSFEVDLTGLSTAYAQRYGVFRTPRIMPGVYYLRQMMKAGNALSTNRAVYFDKMALGKMGQVYVSGPSLCPFGGSVPFARGDYTTVEVTNSRGAGGTLDTFQTLVARLLQPFIGSGLLLPSSANPTISDGLITA